MKKHVAGIAIAAFLVLTAGAYAEDDLVKITAAGTIRVGTEGNYSPFTYRDAKGTLVGFDVEIAQEIGKRLGRKSCFHRRSLGRTHRRPRR